MLVPQGDGSFPTPVSTSGVACGCRVAVYRANTWTTRSFRRPDALESESSTVIGRLHARMTNKSLTLHIVSVVRAGAAPAHANGDAHDARANDQQATDRD